MTRNPFRRLLVGLGLGFLAILGLVLWLGGPRSEVTLADGTRLRLLGVTAGTNRFSNERSWHLLVRKHVPPQYHRWLPKTINASCGTTNSMTLWLEHYDPVRRANLYREWHHADTITDAGEVLPNFMGSQNCSQSGLYQAISLEVFPRRQRTILVRLYDRGFRKVAQLRVPNPWRGPFPEWKPEPFPVTKTNGDLTVTCKGWKRVLNTFWYDGREWTNQNLSVSFDYRWAGVPTDHWDLRRSRLHDATGNAVWNLVPELALSEPVWRLNAWFRRRPEAAFAPDERLVLTNLAVLAPGESTHLNLNTNLQGVGLTVVGWSGPATFTFTNGMLEDIGPPQGTNRCRQVFQRVDNGVLRTAWSFGDSTLLFRHDRVRLEMELEVDCHFRDSSGRLLYADREQLDQDMGDYRFAQRYSLSAYQPRLPRGTTNITVEVIVQRLRMLEFYLEPPRTAVWSGPPPEAIKAATPRKPTIPAERPVEGRTPSR